MQSYKLIHYMDYREQESLPAYRTHWEQLYASVLLLSLFLIDIYNPT